MIRNGPLDHVRDLVAMVLVSRLFVRKPVRDLGKNSCLVGTGEYFRREVDELCSSNTM